MLLIPVLTRQWTRRRDDMSDTISGFASVCSSRYSESIDLNPYAVTYV